MAWWTEIISRPYPPETDKETNQEEEKDFFSAALSRVVKAVKILIYDNFIDFLYLALSLFTYLYLSVSVFVFFFNSASPKILRYLVEATSEPYLGALAIYLIVKELEHRRSQPTHRRHGEFFVSVWFVFFVCATILTLFSEQYQLDGIYKTIVTNSFAAVIIHAATLLRF